MDLFLALDLLHAMAALAWAAGIAVLAATLLAARRDTAARARPEVALLGARVLGPLTLLATATGLALAARRGLALEAWVVLGALLAGASLAARQASLVAQHASLAARRVALAPALDRAARSAKATCRAHRLAALDLQAQVAVFALMVLRPGWPEALILAGLLACLLLAAAAGRSLAEPA